MYTRILVPLDGSKLAECSLDHIKNIAQGHPELEVVLLTIQEEVIPYSSVPLSGSKARDEAEQREKVNRQTRQQIEKYLADIVNYLSKEGITVKTRIIFPDPLKGIAEIIMDYAVESKTDLIVMSTHGRSGIKRWAFGSVADRILNYSRVPVLIVPLAACRT